MNENVMILKKIADRTGKKIIKSIEKMGMEVREEVKIGAYGVPSSKLDLIAEKTIIDFVEDNDLPYNIFTEESGYIDRRHEKTLIVDPVDGSYNAENGIPFYAISLAVARTGLSDVEIALVRNVPMNIDYWAVKGSGAFRDGEKLAVNENKNLFVLYMGKKSASKIFDIAKKARRVRSIGCASLEMAMVAEGTASLFYYNFTEGGALRIVDIAAGTLIVREAGGLVLDENLNELNMKLDFNERKNVIAVASKKLLEVIK